MCYNKQQMAVEYICPSESDSEWFSNPEAGCVECRSDLGRLAIERSNDNTINSGVFSLAPHPIHVDKHGPECDLPGAVDEQEIERLIQKIEKLLDKPKQARLAQLAELASRSETVIDDRFGHEPPVDFKYY